jgi:DNA-binding NtrC family response regulator
MNMNRLPEISQDMILELQSYHWPGNVRELKNKLERALMLWDGDSLDMELHSKTPVENKWSEELPFPANWTLKDVNDEIKRIMCAEALRRTAGNKKEASDILGISRDALYRYIRLYGIETDLYQNNGE